MHDWTSLLDQDAGRPIGTPEQRRIAVQASPVGAVGTWRSPVLMIHGDDDRNVPFSQSVDLVQRLRVQGVEVQELVLPDEIHDILVHAHKLQAFRATAEFLERNLLAP